MEKNHSKVQDGTDCGVGGLRFQWCQMGLAGGQKGHFLCSSPTKSIVAMMFCVGCCIVDRSKVQVLC